MDPPSNLSIDYLNLLPDELLLEILLKTNDLDTLSIWCQTSKRINNICQDKVLWKQKYQKDFGSDVTLVKGDTWKELYKRMVLPDINSPIYIGAGGYGIIDQKGDLYMTGAEEILGIGIQLQGRMGAISKKQHLVKFPSNNRNSSLSNLGNPTPKVVSISIEFYTVGAVTADGKAYVWGNNTYGIFGVGNGNLICSPRELTLPKNKKAKRIEISELGYIVLLEDSTVYLRVLNRNNKTDFLHIMDLKIIDISIVGGMYTIITKDHKLYIGAHIGDGYIIGKKFIDLAHLVFPERVKQVSINDFRLMVLSITGNVYTQDFNNYV